MMSMKPLHEYVLVKLFDPDGRTKGGILIPDQAKDRWKVGHVDAVGSEVTEVQRGEWVLFNPWTGMPVPDDSGRLMLRQSDCVSVIEDFDPAGWGYLTDEVV